MASCARCSATPADFFSGQGDSLCRPCFAADQQRGANERAQASLAQTGVEGVRYSSGPSSPKRAIAAGGVGWAGGIGLGGATFLLTGDVYVWFVLIAGAGVASLARGLTLRGRQ